MTNRPPLAQAQAGFPSSDAWWTAQVYNPINWLYGQVGDPNGWVPLTSLGSFQNSSTAGTVTPQARDIFIAGQRIREFKGIVNLTGVGTTSFNFFMFSAAYQPTYERDWAAAGQPSSTPFRVYLSTAGNWGMTGQASGMTSINLDQFRMFDPPGTI